MKSLVLRVYVGDFFFFLVIYLLIIMQILIAEWSEFMVTFLSLHVYHDPMPIKG